jgi:hypothetical protein
MIVAIFFLIFCVASLACFFWPLLFLICSSILFSPGKDGDDQYKGEDVSGHVPLLWQGLG